MQDTTLLNEGLALMGLGMGFVFVFLSVLVMITTLMSRCIGRYFPEPSTQAVPSAPAPASRAHDDELMAVLAAAVHRYRREQRH